MSKWINVAERLPEKNMICLVYVKGAVVDGFIVISDYFQPEGFNKHITHWMPLPDAPGKDNIPFGDCDWCDPVPPKCLSTLSL